MNLSNPLLYIVGYVISVTITFVALVFTLMKTEKLSWERVKEDDELILRCILASLTLVIAWFAIVVCWTSSFIKVREKSGRIKRKD